MKNKLVGILIIGIAILIGFMTYSFNRALSDIVSSACVHGPACPMWGTIRFQTNASIGIMVFVVLIGLYLIIFGEDKVVITKIKKVNERARPKKITKESYRKVMTGLRVDEKRVFETVLEARGSIMQSDLVGKTKLNKVKVTRILDKLEGKNLVERKRRGMSNVVILKH